MKKLLAIILAVVCIIPTMAVSFSVSAKAATNNVNSKDAFMYQYSEKTYTVKKTKTQQKYKFDYSVSNNKDNSVIVVKNDGKTKFQVTIGGNKKLLLTDLLFQFTTRTVTRKLLFRSML